MQNQTQEKSNSPTQWSDMSASMQSCIQNCTDCYQMCTQMITHCLQKGGDHANPEHIKILLDCAKICETSAAFMIRDSKFHSLTCGTCAEICLACAKSCSAIKDCEMMQACARVCQKCATSCEEMSKMQ